MDSSNTGNMETNDCNTHLGRCSSYQEIIDLIKVEDIKKEPCYPEQNCPPLEPVIKVEADVPKQNDKLMTLLSTSGEQNTSMKIESDDLGVWEDEPIDFDNMETGSAVPWKSENEIQNGMGKMCETLVESPGHLMFHNERKLHNCDVCGKEFTQKHNVKHHMLSHSKEKPYECNICGKAFTHKAGVKMHLMIHTEGKPYVCDVCGQSFAQKDRIRRHMVIHMGEKSHECNICGKKFLRKNAVKQHMRIHTGEKPHECNVCGKAFAQSNHMKRHMIIHTRVKKRRPVWSRFII